jgi:hypothetical protein
MGQFLITRLRSFAKVCSSIKKKRLIVPHTFGGEYTHTKVIGFEETACLRCLATTALIQVVIALFIVYLLLGQK